MIWDFYKSSNIIKIVPTVLYHKKVKIFEIGWGIWSLLFKV